jgi:hypothetical protein
MQTITTIGLGIAKSVFQVHAQGAAPPCYAACPSIIGRGSPHPEVGCSK